jgi:hypothetical protein
VALRNTTVLQFLQDHRRFLHFFGWTREATFFFVCLKASILRFTPQLTLLRNLAK